MTVSLATSCPLSPQPIVANRAKAKGTAAESAVRDYFREAGYPYADRLVLHGAADKGDIRLGDGIPVAIEVKGGQKALQGISGHVNEMVEEVRNAGAETGVTIIKRARSANVGEWYAVMPVWMWADLIRKQHPYTR